jgi:hypothetical protein
VGPRTGLDAVARRKIPNYYRESKPGRPTRSLVTVLAEVSRFPDHDDNKFMVLRKLSLNFKNEILIE